MSLALFLSNTIPATATSGGSEQACNISFPEFYNCNPRVRKHEPAHDEEMPSSSRPSPPLVVRRANNLLAAGHYQEAIEDFSRVMPKWKVPAMFRHFEEFHWGLACYLAGDSKQALEHARLAGYTGDGLSAKLLLEGRQFKKARDIADNRILDGLVSEASRLTASDQPAWLRVRASANLGLGQYRAAVNDLKQAAQRYYLYDTGNTEKVLAEANAIIKEYSLGKPINSNDLDIPSKGKSKALRLIRFLVETSNPFSVNALSNLTGSKIGLPGRTWHSIYTDEDCPAPFKEIEYRTEHDDSGTPHLLTVRILESQCCIPKIQVMKLIPHHLKKIEPISIWNGGLEGQGCEAWNLPTGRLLLRFNEGGAQGLKSIELAADDPGKRMTGVDYLLTAGYVKDRSKKIELLTKGIEKDPELIDAYLSRAEALIVLGRLEEALEDSKKAVSLGGRFYLNEQSDVEEKQGNLDAAIEHMNTFIGSHPPGPETARYFTKLGELYLKAGRYADCREAIEKAFSGSRETAEASLLKAKLEKACGNFERAREGAQKVADEYFDQARIVLRDRVQVFLDSLPDQ